jgi:hypothetical protein
MKKLRNFYFVVGFGALVFALLAAHIPGVTITDFVLGFCYGLGAALLFAGLLTWVAVAFRRPKESPKGATNGLTKGADIEKNATFAKSHDNAENIHA